MSLEIIHSVLTVLLVLGCKATIGSPIVSEKIFPSPRIMKGEDASFGDHPYLVHISFRLASGQYQLTCGGAILDERTIVTTAHCFKNNTGHHEHSCWHENNCYKLVAGDHDVNERDEREQEVYFSRRNIRIHENYARGPYTATFNNDIAIIRLDEPLEFNDHVNCINLPSSKLYYEGAIAKIAGWGSTSNENLHHSRFLKDADVIIHCKRYCEQQWGDDFNSTLMLCAGGDAELFDDNESSLLSDACLGDSGGPLIYNTDRLDRWCPFGKYLVGLTSWGSSFQCGNRDYPGVYTHIKIYVPWINEVAPSPHRLRCKAHRRPRRFNTNFPVRNCQSEKNSHRILPIDDLYF